MYIYIYIYIYIYVSGIHDINYKNIIDVYHCNVRNKTFKYPMNIKRSLIVLYRIFKLQKFTIRFKNIKTFVSKTNIQLLIL